MSDCNKFHPRRQAEPGDSSNAGQRAARGQAAVNGWCAAGGDTCFDESNIRDTICDVLHYCHKMWSRKNGYGGESPVEQAEMAINMWREESHNE